MLMLTSCGGGGTSTSPAANPVVTPTSVGLFTQPAQVALTSAEVGQIVAQAAEEAAARGRPSVIAVTDRVGNVLAVFRMTGAPAMATLRAGTVGNTDFQGVAVPAALAAISKAVTGAYLSSGGNAFSTRTASMIVQEHFPPSAVTPGLESGPLFGVQFSQLPCSDLSRRFVASATPDALIGPKRAPLGLAADPGGLPLYKGGVVVGGIGVMGDGDYGLDTEVRDVDTDDEELIAVAGTVGFAAPVEIRAERVSVDGSTLRYIDQDVGSLRSTPASARSFAAVSAALGSLTAVTGYYGPATLAPLAGTPYGTEASGIRKATTAEFNDPDAYILTDGSGVNRYPVRAGTDAGDVATPLTAAEARALLEEAFKVMARARAQIRQPLDSRAQVSITVIDTRGVSLGLVRSPDAPIFGIDVALQKARTVALLSGPRGAADLGGTTLPGGAADPNVRAFVGRMAAFLPGSSGALTGAVAFGDRSVGNLARPYYPDGEVGRPNGPLSRPIGQFSPFSTGLQSALLVQNVVQHVVFVSGGGPDTAARCTFLPDAAPGQNRLQNGLQIFAGAVPVYRGNVMVGAVGVSGDGIDQDDMISFLGTNNASVRLGASITNAPVAIRADQVVVPVGAGARLRYVSCPFAPFIDSNANNVCQGL